MGFAYMLLPTSFGDNNFKLKFVRAIFWPAWLVVYLIGIFLIPIIWPPSR